MTTPDPVVTVSVSVWQVSPHPRTVNISDRGLRTYELLASDADVTADDVEALCSSVFELAAVVRALRDGTV